MLKLVQSAFIIILNKESKKKPDFDAIEMKTGFNQREREEKQRECDEKLRDLVEQLKEREDKMEKLYQVMGNGGSFQSTLSRVKIWLHYF